MIASNTTKTKSKVVIIGTGMVGMSYAYSLLNQGTVKELVLIDIDKKRAEGEAMDCLPNLKSPPGFDSKVAPYQSNVPLPNKPSGVKVKEPSRLKSVESKNWKGTPSTIADSMYILSL